MIKPLSYYWKLEFQARQTPHRVVVVDQDAVEISARELLQEVERRAFELEYRAKSARYVVLVGGASAACFAWTFAILGRNRVLVPVDGRWPRARVDSIVAEVRHVDPEAWVIHGGEPVESSGTLAANAANAPEAPAVVLFTSGSTGRPKGVVLSHENLMHAECELPSHDLWNPGCANANPEKTVFGALLNYASFSHATHINHITAVATGHTVVCVSPSDILDVDHMVGIFNQYRIRKVLLTPTFCARALDFPKWFETLNGLYLYGEPVPVELASRIRRLLPHITHMRDLYGQTEGTRWFASRNLRGDRLWKANSGVELEIREGQIWVRNRSHRSLFLGYLGQSERPHDAPLRTGDLAEGTPRAFKLGGRVDNLCKVRGHRVELTEVEGELARLTNSRCAVVLHSDQLIGFVERPGCAKIANEERRKTLDSLRLRLPAHAVPSQLRFVDAIPMSDNHKIDRQKLLGWSRQKPNPLGEIGGGDIVIRLFRRLFPGAGVLNDESSFRDLGGYSLLLMEAVTWLRNEGIGAPPAPATLMKLDKIGAIRKALARQEPACAPDETMEPVAMRFSTLPSLSHCVRHPLLAIKLIASKGWRTQLRVDREIVSATSVDIPIATQMTDDEIRELLSKLITLHPVLRSRRDPYGGVRIPRGEPYPPALRRPWSPRFLERAKHLWEMMPGQPLFRVTRPSNDLIKIWLHHSIGDNESCEILTRDFQSLLKGLAIPARPYANLKRARQQLSKLPLVCPYETPPFPGPSLNQTVRHAVWLLTRVGSKTDLLLPSLVIAFARAMGGRVTVPVVMDARFARNLFDVDTTQLISCLLISRKVTAIPDMFPAALRDSLEQSEPQYYTSGTFRGSRLFTSYAKPTDNQMLPPAGEINLVIVRTGSEHRQHNRTCFLKFNATLGEQRFPRVASVRAEYYPDSHRISILALGPTMKWVREFAAFAYQLMPQPFTGRSG